MTAHNSTPSRRPAEILTAPSVRQHLAIVGLALLSIGVMAMIFLPEKAAVWLVVGVIVVAHTGLFLVSGAALLRWLARRR